MKKRKIILLLVICLITRFITFGQQDSNQIVPKLKPSPKIGLVLSGGGAKGLAHVGVLKVLEECGIKPDYITGTSMGSIVGGLYSLGYTATEIDSIIKRVDWNVLLSDKIAYREIRIFDKDIFPGYPLKLIFNKKEKPDLPSGMIEGQNIHSLFQKLCWLSNKYKSFDDFPIPFRCVATDIMTGQAIVFKDGNLSDAMRISMSIPTVFSPIILDTLLLADGGMVRNYPVQECIDMGADIIIGSYTGFNENAKPKDIHSITKILTRSSAFLGINDAKIQLPKTNILIIPNLTGYGPENFTKASQIIMAGEKAARDSLIYQKLFELGTLLKNTSKIEKKDTLGNIRVDQIMINGASSSETSLLKELCNIYPRMETNSDILKKAVDRLYSTGEYKTVSYHFEKMQDLNVLVFQCNKNEDGKIEVGLNYDNSYGPAIITRYSMRDFLLLNSLLKIKLAISESPRMKVNYDYFLTKGKRIAILMETSLQTMKMPNVLRSSDTVVVLGHYKYNLLNYTLGCKWQLWKNGMIESVFGQNFSALKMKEGMQYMFNLKELYYSDFYSSLKFKINTLDDPFFPTKGVYTELGYKWIINSHISSPLYELVEEDFSSYNDILQFSYVHFIRFKKKFSLIPEISFGFMQFPSFLTEKYFIGGHYYQNNSNTINMSGLSANNLVTSNYIKLGLGTQLRIFDYYYIQAGLELMGFFDSENVYTEDAMYNEGEVHGWYSGLGVSTPFGPIRVVCSGNIDTGELFWSLHIGVPF